MKFDQYNLEARILPAIIASLPFFVLYSFFLNEKLDDFFELIFGATWPGDISTAVAFLFLVAFLGRAISKDIFERVWFKSDETKMPTTNLLLHSNTEYSDQFKDKIYQKIKNDFAIEILSAEDEHANEHNARKVISEAVTLIRHKLNDGRLILARNIEYGFIRNLIGCSVISVLVSLSNIVIFSIVEQNHLALIISVIMFVIYFMPIILSKLLIKGHGKRYARSLFQEYIV